MSKVKVYELAKELGKDSKDVVKFLEGKNIEVKNHMSTISEDEAAMVKKALGGSKASASGDEAKAAPKKKNIVHVFRPQNTRDGSRNGRRQAGRPAGGAKAPQNAKPMQVQNGRPAPGSKPAVKSVAKPAVKPVAEKPAEAVKPAEVKPEVNAETVQSKKPESTPVQPQSVANQTEKVQEKNTSVEKPVKNREEQNRNSQSQEGRRERSQGGYNRDRQGRNDRNNDRGDRNGRPQGDRRDNNRGRNDRNDRQGGFNNRDRQGRNGNDRFQNNDHRKKNNNPAIPAPALEGQKPQQRKNKGKEDFKKKDYRKDDEDRMPKGRKQKNDQKQQMQKQEGNNVNVSAIYGNFDDAQSFLKRVFVDPGVNAYADEKGVLLSSANSINIGRLFPQVAYYVSTYVSLVDNGAISEGEIFDVVVPTGNFGNILAGYFAKKMGVPIGKLICASNKNKVLADFFETGVYDMNRQFFTTDSPSMDILLSSNFERFLFYVAGQDAEKVAEWEKDLSETGKIAVSAEELAQLRREFEGGWIDDGETEAVINHVYNDYGYLLDPHTAVAYGVYMNRRRQGLCEGRHTVVMATAHPYKFPPVICQALALPKHDDAFDELLEIADVTGMALPKPLAELRNKPVRFGSSIEKEDMKQAVLAFVDAIHGRA